MLISLLTTRSSKCYLQTSVVTKAVHYVLGDKSHVEPPTDVAIVDATTRVR